jgi:cation diffusion facilitator family transporter
MEHSREHHDHNARHHQHPHDDHDHPHAGAALEEHAHRDHEHSAHGHSHGVVDASITTSNRGIWAIKWSFVGLGITAVIQLAVVIASGSVALLADMIHNVGDAATAIPLGIAFLFGRHQASKRFTFGHGRVEDIAGVLVVLTILFSALVAAYESIDRLLHPRPIEYLGAVAVAAVIGFLGNEAVAAFRIRVGKEIESAALIADGYHARVDGWTSLAVLLGAIGVWLGYPLADPLIGLLISIVIFGVVWQSGKAVFTRMLDGVDPHVIDEIEQVASEVAGVQEVSEVRARWIGHRLSVEANIAVRPELSVGQGHAIAQEVNHQLRHHLGYVSLASIHVDPIESAGEAYHRIIDHRHDGLPAHSH